MPTQTLAPDSIISQSGMGSCVLADVTSDPDSPDANYCDAASAYSDTTLRVSFATPTNVPKQGAGLQKFRIEYKFHGNLLLTLNPTIKIAIRETGGGSDLASTTINVPIVASSFVSEFNWDASLLSSADGSKVECYLVVTHKYDGAAVGSADIGGVEWVEEYAKDVSGDIAFDVPVPTISADASYTAPQPQFNGDISFSVPTPSVSAGATYTQAQFAGDISFSVPAPSVFAAAEYMPVSGTTGWIQPSYVKQYGLSGEVTWSNASNASVENESVAVVNLYRYGARGLQNSASLKTLWVDPANYPAGAFLVGIEFKLYAQFDTENHDDHAIYPYYLSLGDSDVEVANVSDHALPQNSEASPLYSKVITWGGKTDLLGHAYSLVSDFLAENCYTGEHLGLQIRNDVDPLPHLDDYATIKVAYLSMKIWWEIPNYVDMASDISCSVTVSDSSAPLQKIRDLESDISASAAVSDDGLAGVPITMASAPSISVIIEPPTISEGSTYIDMACYMYIAVDPTFDGIKMRNLYADANFNLTMHGSIGFSNPLDIDYAIAVTMDPQLHRDVEMQTDALSAWFEITMDPGLLGTFMLETDMPIAVTMDVDGMVVNWALYSEPQFEVTMEAEIAAITNLYSNIQFGVTMDPQLQAITNIYSDMTIDGFFINTGFIKLPVPAPDDRTMYLQPKERVMKIPTKDRVITLVQSE